MADSSTTTQDLPQEGKKGRKAPIKTLLFITVVSQPVLVAISLFYTEVWNKQEPVRCDPALIAALIAPAPVPAASYYPAGSAAQTAYEAGFTSGFNQTLQEILALGCNKKLPETVTPYVPPVGINEEESAKRNGLNDGRLAARVLPRECLNDCWQRAIRRR